MKLKRIFPALALLSMLVAVVFAQGPYVEQHHWDIVDWSETAQRTRLTAGTDDAGVVPLPADVGTLLTAGFTLTCTTRIGQNLLLENNRVWPFGTNNGSPDDPENWCTVHFRKGVHRSIDKGAIIATYVPLKSAAEAWLPPAQQYWINPDIALPSFDPGVAAAEFDEGGFVEGSTPNPYYNTTWHPASAAFIRIDPTTGLDLAPINYVAVRAVEDSLGWAAATDIQRWLRYMGIPVTLTGITWIQMVTRVVAHNYQLLSGFDIFWGTTAPDNLYDLTYSTNLPLWNLVGMNITGLNAAGLNLMSTLDILEARDACFEMQEYLRDYEPYLPLLVDEGYAAFTGPWTSSQGYLGIVNAGGQGALGYSTNIGFKSPRGQVWASNMWAKLLGRSGYIDPTTGMQVNRWILPDFLTTLNPLTANTETDWQALSLVTDVLLQQNPYTQDYMPWAAETMPVMRSWVGPGRAQIGGNGVYDAPVTFVFDPLTGQNEVESYNGIPVDLVTEEDLLGDDQLGMRTYWTLRDNLYWHDSNPGPDMIFGTGDDGVVHPVTAADVAFVFDLLINQQVERYRSHWWFVNDLQPLSNFRFQVYEERRYFWAFECHSDVALLTPRHIWEPFIAGPDGILWTADDSNYISWFGWTTPYIPCPIHPPGLWLTQLIGCGPFHYHLGGWMAGFFVNLEANTVYFGGTPPLGDVNLDLAVRLIDIYIVVEAFGTTPAVANYDPRADVAYPAQLVDLYDIFTVAHDIGKKWGP